MDELKIEKTDDVTVRTITYEVAGAPDLDITQSYQSTQHVIRPDRAEIRIAKIATIRIFGPRVLKGGRLSENSREGVTFSTQSWRKREQTENAPQWARDLLASAQEG
jgi:hypothetical protein